MARDEFNSSLILEHSCLDRFVLWCLLAVLACCGVSCSMVPALKKDDFTVPSEFKEGQKTEAANLTPVLKPVTSPLISPLMSPVESSKDTPPKAQAWPLSTGPWWLELGEPELNRLQEQLLKSNVSVLQLSAQVRLAQASLKQAESSLFPSLNLNTSASRAANQLSVPKGTSYSLSAPMSWELDVWGRIDALTQVAAANSASSQWDLRQAQVSVQALLVQSFITLLAASGQEALLSQTVQVYEKSVSLTQARYKAGVVSSADVAQALTQLKSTQAQWQEIVLQRKQIEHALATLLGVVPAQLKLDRVGYQVKGQSSAQHHTNEASALSWPLHTLPQVPSLPNVLVLDILQYRADIQAAKRRVEAANALLGVARAAFFPPLVLSASAGYRNTDLSSLISAPNQAWSIGPSLVLPLFDGGLRQAAKESAQAQLDNSILAYRQVVLNAFQEIEDNLVAQEQLALVETALKDANQSAAKNLEITQAQYRSGVVPYLSVVNAQSAYLSAQRSLLDAKSRRLLAWNQLKKNTFVQVAP